MAASCGRSNDPLLAIKDEEFIEHPNDCVLLKKYSSPWS
jgi:hypothetical protein